MPELSFGTHFFQDLVEADIFYAALFSRNGQAALNNAWRSESPNRLADLLPQAAVYTDVVKVCDCEEPPVYLMADIASQRVVCFSAATRRP